MNKAEHTVLNILSDILNGKPFAFSSDEDWGAVQKELKAQSLLPMAYLWVKKHKSEVPEEFVTACTKAFASQSFRWYAMIGEQKKLIELIRSNGYDLAIMKGSAVGVYFPVPQVRGSGDVDFLVKWDDYDAIFQLLIENGYSLIGEKKESKHHVALTRNKVVFEMHKRPGGTHLDGTEGQKYLIQFFQNGLDAPAQITNSGYSMPVLPKCQNGMVLLMHTAGHMKEGLGLRHLLDWMMYVKAEVHDDFWKCELEPKARMVHLDTFAKILTRTCQIYLGLTNEITWCKDADEELCGELMEFFLYQGDFGSKSSENDQETKVMTESDSVKGFWNKLYNSSLYSFPAARKHKVLVPAACIYQLYRYLKKGLTKDHPIASLLQSRRKGRERREFFNKLEIWKQMDDH